jgi:hypothetical protein
MQSTESQWIFHSNMLPHETGKACCGNHKSKNFKDKWKNVQHFLNSVVQSMTKHVHTIFETLLYFHTDRATSLVSEVSTKVCGQRVLRGQCNRSPWPYSRISRPEPLLFLPSSSSIVLMRLSGPCSRPITSQKVW